MRKLSRLSIQLAVGLFLPFIASAISLIYHFPLSPGIFVFILTLFCFSLYWYWFLLSKIREKIRTAATLLEAASADEYSFAGPLHNWDSSFSMLIAEINQLSESLKRKQYEIRSKSNLLKKVLDKIPVAILTFDPQDRVTLANPYAGSLYNCSPDSLLYKTIEELNLYDVIKQKTGVFEYRFPAESGKWRFETTHFYSTGEENRLLIMANLTQTLREETLNAWKKLIRVMTHEINNSLSPIQSTAETLSNLLSQTDVERSDLMRSGMELITDRARHLHGFINEYSRISKLPEPQRKPVALHQILDHIQALYQDQPFQKSGQLDVTLKIDPTMFQQALINLVKNAREAMEGKEGVIEFEGKIKNNTFILSIKDQGHGIGNPENIMTPFYTTKSNGAGIGLALCNQIIEAHRGTLTIQNRPEGAGAEVVLTLPIG